MRVPSPRGPYTQLRQSLVSIEGGAVCLNRRPLVRQDPEAAEVLLQKVRACLEAMHCVMHCNDAHLVSAIAQHMRSSLQPELYAECLTAIAIRFWIVNEYALPEQEAEDLIREAARKHETPPATPAEAFGIWFTNAIRVHC